VTVVVLTACPPGLRGQITRWLMEIAPGVFVGYISTRVRELLWLRIVEHIGRGRALMVHATKGEQRLAFRVHGHDWTPVDHDGVQLMRRPRKHGTEDTDEEATSKAPKGWSHAGRRRRFG
jgi:CRISPR-associated protein Cas2